MNLPPDSGADSRALQRSEEDTLAERVETLATWINEIDGRLRAAAVATDEKALKELRRTLDAISKRDPKLEERLTNKVDVIADRMQTLATTVATTGAAIAKKDGDVAALRRELDAHEARFDAVVSELRRTMDLTGLDELRRTIAALSEERPAGKGDDRQLGGLSGKIDVLSERVDSLTKTVATTANGLAGRDGELAAVRKKYDADIGSVEAAVSELRHAVDPAPVQELRHALKTLSDETSALKRANQRGLDAVNAKVETLGGHYDPLVKSATATATGLAATNGEIAALRTAFDEETRRLDSNVVKLHQAIGPLASQLAALGSAVDRDTVEALDDRLAGVSDLVEAMGTRLGALASTVDAVGKDFSDKEFEIAALSRRFDEAGSRVDGLVTDLRSALETMPALGSREELETRVDELAERVDALVSQLERLDATTSKEAARAAEAAAEEREAIGAASRALQDRLEGLDAEVGVLCRRFDEAGSRADASFTELRAELEIVAEASSDPEREARFNGLAQHVDALGSQLVRLETMTSAEIARAREAAAGEHETIAAGSRELVDRVQEVRGQVAAIETRLGALHVQVETIAEAASDARLETRFDGLAQDVEALARQLAESAATTSRSRRDASEANAELEVRLSMVAGRIDALEQGGASAAAEVARAFDVAAEDRAAIAQLSRNFDDASARVEALVADLRVALETMPTPGDALESRLGELAERVDALAGQVPQREMLQAQRELEHRLEVLASRLEATERGREAVVAEVARVSAARGAEVTSLRDQLDALAVSQAESGARLDSLVQSAGIASAALESGEGRFRLELRGLELRTEHAEAAARENREAVLMQLERLASQVERRLQQLETPSPDAPQQPSAVATPLGQVVPLRSEA